MNTIVSPGKSFPIRCDRVSERRLLRINKLKALAE
jgi:hypothetical protein